MDQRDRKVGRITLAHSSTSSVMLSSGFRMPLISYPSTVYEVSNMELEKTKYWKN